MAGANKDINILKYNNIMETKFTKGKWEWQLFGDNYLLTAQHGMREIIIGAIMHPEMDYPVVGMNNDGLLRVIDKDHPNAKLIAAAPDLLQDHISDDELILDFIGGKEKSWGDVVYFLQLLRVSKAAIIQKATE